ncbi:MAG: malonyl-CoA decarboxylase domain-containing protein [Alphaproteobacteria bacterium]
MPDSAKQFGLLDRTLSHLRGAWRDISASARVKLSGAVRPDLPEDDAARLVPYMHECLKTRGGEVSARARAADLGRTYLTLDKTGRKRFLRLLASEFDTDQAAVDAAIAAVQRETDTEKRRRAEAALRRVLLPPRVILLRQFNTLPEGIKFLVDLRADLLELGKRDSLLRALEADLKQLLADWFDIGLLDLLRITWNSPAALLEKLIAYEAVHEIRSWSDLKNRLDADRRWFAFVHPKMPDEPIIFIEVALVDGMADNIQALLDESAPRCDPNAVDTAIFYSISNAQPGLAGIGFGNFLIKRVVDELVHELTGLKTFATLSPAPGFCAWLESRLVVGGDDLVTPAEAKALAAHVGGAGGSEALRRILDSSWRGDDKAVRLVRRPLMRLCAHYLLNEKRDNGQPLDPVARFHLINGARIGRINWLADTSAKGLRESAGMMVNYLYLLDEIEKNHEAFSGEGKITASTAVRALLRGRPLGLAKPERD